MKKASIAVVALMIVAGAALAGPKDFGKGSFTLTPQAGINRWTIPFGLNVEYGMSPHISLGGTAMIWLWSDEWASESLISLSAEALYHFTQINVRSLDLFAGLALGFALYSYNLGAGYDSWSDAGASGLDLGLVLGGRYYFTPKLGVCLRFVSSFIGSWSGVGGQIGLTFRTR